MSNKTDKEIPDKVVVIVQQADPSTHGTQAATIYPAVGRPVDYDVVGRIAYLCTLKSRVPKPNEIVILVRTTRTTGEEYGWSTRYEDGHIRLWEVEE